MTPRTRSDLFRFAVAAFAAAVFLADLRRLPAGGMPDPPLAAALTVAGLLALQFPLQVSLSEKVSVATSVFFAAAFLMPAWQAAALVAVTQGLSTAVSAARKVRATKQAPHVGAIALSLVFNSGQGYLAVLVAGLILGGGGVSAGGGIPSLQAVAGLVTAAMAMYAVNHVLVSTAVALSSGSNPITVFLTTQKLISARFAGLYLVGASTAFAQARFPWALAFSILPGVLVYESLKRRIELRRVTVRAVERMADKVDARDPYTFHHSQRVATYSNAIGRRLRFSEAEIELIELAAKVHDIGKIRIPDSVLLKPSMLTGEEQRLMETHPRLGVEILSQFAEYSKVLELVLAHHERYDGRGYPNRTVGSGLLLIAQVIPVADSLDAMTTTRAYRKARSWNTAMNELRRGAGTQWNPQVVDAALAVLGANAATAGRSLTSLGDLRRVAKPSPGGSGRLVDPRGFEPLAS